MKKIEKVNSDFDITQLRNKLRHGDRSLIAEMTGYSTYAITAQLMGERTLKQVVVDAILKLEESRNNLLLK